MNFTDDDLKRLKEDMTSYPELIDFKVDLLLARLEAASALADAAIECGVGKPLWDAYLKAAGK